MAGLDPERRSYFSRASFADPDGNRWLLQEITERLPGGCERTGDPAPTRGVSSAVRQAG